MVMGIIFLMISLFSFSVEQILYLVNDWFLLLKANVLYALNIIHFFLDQFPVGQSHYSVKVLVGRMSNLPQRNTSALVQRSSSHWIPDADRVKTTKSISASWKETWKGRTHDLQDVDELSRALKHASKNKNL